MTNTTPSTYPKLLQDLQKLITQSREQAINTLNQIRIQTYYKMGERSAKAKEIQDPKRGSAWMKKLAQDLDMDVTQLYRIKQFYLTYPKGLPQKLQKLNLSWSTYVQVLPLPDAKTRNYYLEAFVKQGWTKQQLTQAIQNQAHTNESKASKSKPKSLIRPSNSLYIYRATVIKVVDGDTLLVHLDLGFEVWKTQRIRLRAIDTPEIKTPEGQKAKEYLEQILAPMEVIVIKTNRVDMYHRYVGEVFCKVGETRKEVIFKEGLFLNEALVKAGHAKIVAGY